MGFKDGLQPRVELLWSKERSHAEVEVQRNQEIVGILKDAEAGVAVNDLLRKHGVSRANTSICGPCRPRVARMEIASGAQCG